MGTMGYMYPAVKSFKRYAVEAKVVLFMTWGFRDNLRKEGYGHRCPAIYNEGKTQCFPKGSLMDLMKPS